MEHKPSKEEIVSILFGLMKVAGGIEYGDLYQKVYKTKAWLEAQPIEDMSNGNLLHITLNEFMRAGLLIKGQYYQNPKSSFYGEDSIFITPLGKEVAQAGRWSFTAGGTYRYAEIATQGLPWISEEIKAVLFESYTTWCSGHYRASAILIGLACEYITESFVEEFEKIIPASSENNYVLLFNAGSAKRRITELLKVFEPNKKLSRSVYDQI